MPFLCSLRRGCTVFFCPSVVAGVQELRPSLSCLIFCLACRGLSYPLHCNCAALLPLLLFGPASLFGMVAGITLGLFVGTYSSVYMAAPILVWLGVTSDSFVPTETVADQQEKKARGLV